MAIGTIIAITTAVISITKGAVDKKKARDKYYNEAQSNLYKQRSQFQTQSDEQRQEALKLIAKQYAVDVIKQNQSIQREAQQIADKKIKQDQLIVYTTGGVALLMFAIIIINKKLI